MIYTAPSSYSPPIIPFSIPDAPVLFVLLSATTNLLISAALASMSLFKKSHSLSVKYRTAATAVHFWNEDLHRCQISRHPNLDCRQIRCHPNLNCCWIWWYSNLDCCRIRHHQNFLCRLIHCCLDGCPPSPSYHSRICRCLILQRRCHFHHLPIWCGMGVVLVIILILVIILVLVIILILFIDIVWLVVV